MQKYINPLTSEVFYLEDGYEPSLWIDISVWQKMTDVEVLQHESNPHLTYMVWDVNKFEWVDSRTTEEKLENARTQMPTLSKREFRGRLRDENLFEQVDAYVKASNDGYLQDAWEYADYFSRLDPFIIQASLELGLTPERVDQIWVKVS